MVALLSLALPLSPRAMKALKTFSRRSRRLGALQERLDRGARQRHDRLAGHAALVGRGPGGGDEALRQAVAIGLAEFHEPVLLVAEQMMAERGAEMRQPLVDLGHPLLRRLVEAGAGAMEAGIGALQQPHLLAGQPERGAIVVQHGDPAEQHRVHHDRVPVPRHPQRHLLVDLQQRRIGMRRDQVVEHRRHLGEQLARALQRGDGVGEVRRRGVVVDRGDLGGVVGEGLLEGRKEMLGRDLGERRRLERRLPRLQQRVVGRCDERPLCSRFLTSANSRLRPDMIELPKSISRDGAFLGLLRLIAVGLFREIAALNRTYAMSSQPSPTRRPPDRLAERHHRHQRRDPDRRRSVRRGVCRRLGARDPARSRRHRRAHPAGRAVRARRLHHGGVHPRRAARRAVYASRVTSAAQQSRAPPASNALTLP